MTRKLKTVFQYCFFLGLGVFLIWWSLKDLTSADRQEITNALQRGNFWYIIPGIAILLLSHWVCATLAPAYGAYRLSSLENKYIFASNGRLSCQPGCTTIRRSTRCSTLTRYEKYLSINCWAPLLLSV